MNEKIIQTLCILEHDGRILLGMKKVRLGAGLYNGFGGKVEPGEDIREAALREMKEESGLEVLDLEKFGVLEFRSPKRTTIEGHFFRATRFTGTLIETDEMRPEWFSRGDLPFDRMWSSDLYWWPLYFHGKRFRGVFEFDADDRVVSHELTQVATLDA